MEEGRIRNAFPPVEQFKAARQDGQICATCGGPLGNGPAWLEDLSLADGYDVSYSGAAPTCRSCARDAVTWLMRRPVEDVERWAPDLFPGRRIGLCPGCDRELYVSIQGLGRHAQQRHCSKRCVAVAANKRRKQQRIDQRTRACAACGETFQGTRRGAQYCSSACRQRAYRRRVRPSR